jgi:hypothetical protein
MESFHGLKPILNAIRGYFNDFKHFYMTYILRITSIASLFNSGFHPLSVGQSDVEELIKQLQSITNKTNLSSNRTSTSNDMEISHQNGDISLNHINGENKGED